MRMNTIIIDLKGDVKQQLQDFIQSFDADFSGKNGKEYINDKAVESGYDSNVYYSYDIAWKESSDIEHIINSVMGDLDLSYYDYGDSDYVVQKIDEDKILVAFSYHIN